MIGRYASRAPAVSARYSRWGGAYSLVTEWVANLPGNRYSRRVALLKVALPAIGVGLLLLVVVWPRVAPLFDRLRLAAIDLREARELRMLNPRYAGTDRGGHPYVITAAVGRQVPQRNDVMALDQVVGHLQSRNGTNIVVTADSAVYQTQTQFLDLFGHVTVVHQNGTKIVTDAARLDVANNAGEGHQPVAGDGPSGDITAQGFKVIDKGDIVIFTGQSNMLLKSTKGGQPSPAPAAVPAPVAAAATQIEAKAEPTQGAPSAHPAPAKPQAVPQHAAKAPAHPAPTVKKPG